MKLSCSSKIALLSAAMLSAGTLTAFSQPRAGEPSRERFERGSGREGGGHDGGGRRGPQGRVLKGSVFYLQRIALPEGAKLHVSLIGTVPGAPYLPVATAIYNARSGETRFVLPIPSAGVPAGPYRVQAWIVSNNRVMFVGAQSQTTIDSLDESPRIQLRMVSASENPGKPPTLSTDQTKVNSASTTKPVASNQSRLRGVATKSDRNSFSSEATMELTVEDYGVSAGPPKVLAKRTVQLKGKQSPLEFDMTMNLASFRSGRKPGLRVRVMENGVARYGTAGFIPVTRENIGQPFNVQLFALKKMP